MPGARPAARADGIEAKAQGVIGQMSIDWKSPPDPWLIVTLGWHRFETLRNHFASESEYLRTIGRFTCDAEPLPNGVVLPPALSAAIAQIRAERAAEEPVADTAPAAKGAATGPAAAAFTPPPDPVAVRAAIIENAWVLDADLRAEFDGDKKVYLAFVEGMLAGRIKGPLPARLAAALAAVGS